MYTRKQIIGAMENCLNEREQQIIKTRFGLDDGVTVPLSEIESVYGAAREEVRRLEKRIFTYIKCHS